MKGVKQPTPIVFRLKYHFLVTFETTVVSAFITLFLAVRDKKFSIILNLRLIILRAVISFSNTKSQFKKFNLIKKEMNQLFVAVVSRCALFSHIATIICT